MTLRAKNEEMPTVSVSPKSSPPDPLARSLVREMTTMTAVKAKPAKMAEKFE
ncbi:hypothetical protein GCM10018779_52870 [Streptomyces griseocarneus]|nr:hypothetical protein GCM10018779_52870 [Streptomyces griseocarneus]